MSFSCPIERWQVGRLVCSRVRMELTAVTPTGEARQLFRFDTGADITVVSEDVAVRLGLPPGGTPVRLSGSTATGVGRLVPVTFRFPPDMISGRPRPTVTSTWVVVDGRTRLALVSLHEIDAWFYLGTDDTDMSFTDR